MKLSKSLKKRLQTRYGFWGLITGATSGIGKELATRLAEAGLNIVLTGRRESLLRQVAWDLENTYQIKTKIVVGDLSQESEVYNLIDEVKDLKIGLAIMNAGYGTSGEFIKSDLDAEINMLNLNSKALLILTHHFAKVFSEKKKGGIILMSSMVGFQGVPNAAHYAATKAYVQSLGEALAIELKPKNVDVLAAAPGPVASEFSKRADMQMGKVLRPEDVGVPILRALGRKHTSLPGILTKVLVYSLRTVPRWGKVRIMNLVMGGMTKHQLI